MDLNKTGVLGKWFFMIFWLKFKLVVKDTKMPCSKWDWSIFPHSQQPKRKWVDGAGDGHASQSHGGIQMTMMHFFPFSNKIGKKRVSEEIDFFSEFVHISSAHRLLCWTWTHG